MLYKSFQKLYTWLQEHLNGRIIWINNMNACSIVELTHRLAWSDQCSWVYLQAKLISTSIGLQRISWAILQWILLEIWLTHNHVDFSYCVFSKCLMCAFFTRIIFVGERSFHLYSIQFSWNSCGCIACVHPMLMLYRVQKRFHNNELNKVSSVKKMNLTSTENIKTDLQKKSQCVRVCT